MAQLYTSVVLSSPFRTLYEGVHDEAVNTADSVVVVAGICAATSLGIGARAGCFFFLVRRLSTSELPARAQPVEPVSIFLSLDGEGHQDPVLLPGRLILFLVVCML